MERRQLLSNTPISLYSFANGSDGMLPQGITLDADGNVFGTTYQGGDNGGGTIWELANDDSGTFTPLYSFPKSNGSPVYPRGITVDSQGNLYGTTQLGGANGLGSIWELPSGSSTPTTLYSFTFGQDGGYAIGITLDANGNLFGTSEIGGDGGYGTVWELPNGSNSPTTLYSFTGGDDGRYPAELTVDGNDNLFGTTQLGGANGSGTIWKLANGDTSVSTVYAFNTDSGGSSIYPFGITEDSGGNLYGTTNDGGTSDSGTVWELVNGDIGVTTIYSFTGGGPDGGGPVGLAIDPAGDLYGAAGYSGGGYGNVFGIQLPQLEGDFFGTIPTTALRGDAISPQLQITDISDVGTVVDGDETTLYYLSTTPDLSGIVGSPLAVNEYELVVDPSHPLTESQDVTIPNDVPSGIYYLVAQIDANRSINPNDIANIAVSDPIEIDSNLTGSFTGGIPAAAQSGDTISPGFEITNSADEDSVSVDGDEATVYYLSTTNDLSGVVGSPLAVNQYELALDPGDSFTESQDVTIPEGLDPGIYYLVVQIDANQDLSPGDANNFQASGPIGINLPQLSGEFTGDIPSTAAQGETISPGLEITDDPNSSAVVNGDETTEYYLSTSPDLNGIITTPLATNIYKLNLNPGDSFAEAQDVTIPNDTESGTYYLVAQIDAGQAINPADTELFAASGPILIGGADVTGSFTTQPPIAAKPGDQDDIAFSLTNNGGEEADGSYFMRFYLETTQNLGTGNILVGSDTGSIDLAAGETSDPIDASILLPRNLPSGNYYIVAVVGDIGGIDDTNTDDKTFVSDPIAVGPLDFLANAPHNQNGDDSNAIVMDGEGNIFGIATHGGADNRGSIWELAKGSNTVTTLYTFTSNGNDLATLGYDPNGIAIDSNGNLFGTNYYGGAYGGGTIWELAKGSGTPVVVYAFHVDSINALTGGVFPLSIAIDDSGNLFGTTQFGWDHNLQGFYQDRGILWELPAGAAQINTILQIDPNGPIAYLTSVTVGDDALYGTARLSNSGNGIVWKYTGGGLETIYTFEADEVFPAPAITTDGHGNVYATANGIWELPSGSNSGTLLYSSFQYPVSVMGEEVDGLAVDGDGNIFGITLFGGPGGYGTIFELEAGQIVGQFTGSIPSAILSGGTISPGLKISELQDQASFIDGDETTEYYLSTTPDPSGIIGPSLTSDDEYELTLNPGDSHTEEEQVTIPDDVDAGTYYLIARIDANQTINADDTANFVASGPIQINMPRISAAFTGVIPTAANPGQILSPNLQITDDPNAGPVANGDEFTVYFLSTTPDTTGIDLSTRLIVEDDNLNLDPGQSFIESQGFQIPYNVTPGTYYLIAIYDATQSINPLDFSPFAVSNAITVGFANLDDGALTVTAGENNDDISLTSDGTNLTATLDGVDSAPIPLAFVNSITIVTGPGNKTISLGTGVPNVTVHGGKGTEKLIVSAGDNATFESTGSDNAAGGLIVQGAGTVTLDTANTYGGTTEIDGGTVNVTAAGGIPTDGDVINDGSLDVSSDTSVSQITGDGALTVGPDADLQLAEAPTDPTSTVGSLNINPGGTLDITNNTLLINQSGVSADTLETLLSSGYDHGLWNGVGIISSLAAPNPGAAQTTVGFAVSSGDNSVPAGEIEVAYTLAGDANLDGSVNIQDLYDLARNWVGSGRIFDQGNFNYDGTVDVADLYILAKNWQQSLGGVQAAPVAMPSIMSLLLPAATSAPQVDEIPADSSGALVIPSTDTSSDQLGSTPPPTVLAKSATDAPETTDAIIPAQPVAPASLTVSPVAPSFPTILPPVQAAITPVQVQLVSPPPPAPQLAPALALANAVTSNILSSTQPTIVQAAIQSAISPPAHLVSTSKAIVITTGVVETHVSRPVLQSKRNKNMKIAKTTLSRPSAQKIVKQSAQLSAHEQAIRHDQVVHKPMQQFSPPPPQAPAANVKHQKSWELKDLIA